jgi:hypothetical protein
MKRNELKKIIKECLEEVQSNQVELKARELSSKMTKSLEKIKNLSKQY